ncbi:hypothetical protein Tco_1496529, partial [Tanacetum coccineum]
LTELRAPECPYHCLRILIRLLGRLESEPFEDPVETEIPDSPHTVASPTSLPDSTPPTRHAKETARMDVRVPPAMSPSLSASIAEVANISDLAFCKRFRPSYESSPSSSPPDLPSRKRYREDEGPTAEDEDPVAGDDGIAAGDEGSGMRVESHGLGGDEAVPEGQQRATPVVETAVGSQGSGFVPEPKRPERVSALRQPTLTTWIDPEDDRVYIDDPAYPPPAPPVQTPPSPEWSSGSLPVSPAPSIVSSPISSPMIPLTVSSPVASPATAETNGFLTELGAQVEMQGGLIHDHTVRLGSYHLFCLRGQTDAHRAALWHAISDTQMENQELRLQIAEERRARLDLADIVDSMRRGQEPRGDV